MAGLPSGPRRAFRTWWPRRRGGAGARRAHSTFVSLALIALLGGGPTLSAVCEAMCSGDAAGTSHGRQGIHNAGSHHVSTHAHPASTRAHAASHHERREGAAAPAASSRDAGWTTILLLDHGCCDDLIAAPASLAASRAAGQPGPSSHAALLAFANALETGNRRVGASAHGPPIQVPPIVRPPLVLRI